MPQLTNSDKYEVNDDGSIEDSAKVTFEVTCTPPRTPYTPYSASSHNTPS